MGVFVPDFSTVGKPGVCSIEKRCIAKGSMSLAVCRRWFVESLILVPLFLFKLILFVMLN